MNTRIIVKVLRIISLFIFLGLIHTKSIGQQYLWTTNDNSLFPINSEVKIITKGEVINKLLEYHENYKYYYDFTGFTKEQFLKKYGLAIIGNDKKKIEIFKNKLNNINEISISSIKGNLGNGSVIMSFFVNKNNFDMIVFTNNYEEGAINTYNSNFETKKEIFIKFCKTLINE
jgi:hypothetical protein